MNLDSIELRLLALLQENADLSNADLAEHVGLSAAAVHKRVQRLRRKGYISRKVSILDKDALGLDLLCYLHLKFKHNIRPDNMSKLSRIAQSYPEILECHTLSGTYDAVMKILVKDHNGLKHLIHSISKDQDIISNTYTSIILEEIKSTTMLPLTHLVQPNEDDKDESGD